MLGHQSAGSTPQAPAPPSCTEWFQILPVATESGKLRFATAFFSNSCLRRNSTLTSYPLTSSRYLSLSLTCSLTCSLALSLARFLSLPLSLSLSLSLTFPSSISLSLSRFISHFRALLISSYRSLLAIFLYPKHSLQEEDLLQEDLTSRFLDSRQLYAHRAPPPQSFVSCTACWLPS